MMVLAVSHNTGDPTAHLQAEARRMAELRQPAAGHQRDHELRAN
jgi:hypothetical protein